MHNLFDFELSQECRLISEQLESVQSRLFPLSLRLTLRLLFRAKRRAKELF